MEIDLAARLTTLGHPQRLALFRLLVRRYPDRVPAGELAEAMGVKASTLSAWLSSLVQVGLAEQTRQGTSLQYSVEMTKVRQMLDDLFLDCCRGRPDLCESLALPWAQGVADTIPMPHLHIATDSRYNVLFICTGNSARSIFAESILRHEAGERFNAYSAGTVPYSEINPFTLEVLRSKGHDLGPLRAKTIAEFQGADAPRLDFVFTVCDRAANEECPAWNTQPVSAHWGMPDPVKAKGTVAEQSLAFQHAYGALAHRIRAFAALPLAELNRISLQRAVDDIARSHKDLTE